MSTRMRRRLTTALWVAAVALVALAGVGALGLYLAPRVLPNLETSLAEVDTVQTVAAPGVAVEVTVPAGWTYQRGWGGGDELVLRTPDGRLSIAVSARAGTPAAMWADDADAAALGAAATERLASGLEVLHGEDRVAGEFFAAVGERGAAAAARLVARAPSDGLASYRAEIAGVLESVRVTP